MFRQPDLTPFPKELDWTAETVEPGTTVSGVTCGPIFTAMTHTVPPGISKPCCRYATDGQLACICDARPMSLRKVGYQPIIAKTGEKLVIVLSALAAYKTAKWQQGTALNFTRPKKLKRGIIVTPIKGEESKQLWVKEALKVRDQDIAEFVHHLWQIHALTVWSGFTPRRSLRADATAPISTDPYEPRFTSHTEKLRNERPTDTEAA